MSDGQRIATRQHRTRLDPAWLGSAWLGRAALGGTTPGKIFMYNTDEMTLDQTSKRAMAAYYASGGGDLPTSVKVQVLNGLDYAVLRRGSKVLACYRVRNDGKLKRMIRLPNGL